MAASFRPKADPSIQWTFVEPAALDLTGMKVAVIGGTGGLGRAISHLLAARGAEVTAVGRTFRDAGVARIGFFEADLGLMNEVVRAADELPAEQLDMLVLTTGIFAAPERQVTPEGLERDMAVSFLNRLLLLRRVAPRLGTARNVNATAPRVFVMGFPGVAQDIDLDDLNAERAYKSMTAHLNTIVGNEALVVDSAHRYRSLRVYGLNPGLVKTGIRTNMYGGSRLREKLTEALIGLFAPTPRKYAERIVPLLVCPDIDAHTGAMFGSKGQPIKRSPQMTEEYAEKVIDASLKLVARVTPTETL